MKLFIYSQNFQSCNRWSLRMNNGFYPTLYWPCHSLSSWPYVANPKDSYQKNLACDWKNVIYLQKHISYLFVCYLYWVLTKLKSQLNKNANGRHARCKWSLSSMEMQTEDVQDANDPSAQWKCKQKMCKMQMIPQLNENANGRCARCKWSLSSMKMQTEDVQDANDPSIYIVLRQANNRTTVLNNDT